MNTPRIHAGPYVMRTLTPDYTSALFATLSSAEQCRFLSRPHFEREEELLAWLTDPNWNGRSWVAIDSVDGAVVGRFVAVPTHDPDVTEIGYITVSNRQGRGVARICVAALITHLFELEANQRVIAEIDAENVASIALVKRLGFTLEARLREHERTHKGLCDILIYGLLRREWHPVGA